MKKLTVLENKLVIGKRGEEWVGVDYNYAHGTNIRLIITRYTTVLTTTYIPKLLLLEIVKDLNIAPKLCGQYNGSSLGLYCGYDMNRDTILKCGTGSIYVQTYISFLPSEVLAYFLLKILYREE